LFGSTYVLFHSEEERTLGTREDGIDQQMNKFLESTLTRRRVLRYGAGTMAALSVPGLLAACGDDDGGSTTTAASGEAPKPTGTIDFFGRQLHRSGKEC
jgi:hypothetical protein